MTSCPLFFSKFFIGMVSYMSGAILSLFLFKKDFLLYIIQASVYMIIHWAVTLRIFAPIEYTCRSIYCRLVFALSPLPNSYFTNICFKNYVII